MDGKGAQAWGFRATRIHQGKWCTGVHETRLWTLDESQHFSANIHNYDRIQNFFYKLLINEGPGCNYFMEVIAQRNNANPFCAICFRSWWASVCKPSSSCCAVTMCAEFWMRTLVQYCRDYTGARVASSLAGYFRHETLAHLLGVY